MGDRHVNDTSVAFYRRVEHKEAGLVGFVDLYLISHRAERLGAIRAD